MIGDRLTATAEATLVEVQGTAQQNDPERTTDLPLSQEELLLLKRDILREAMRKHGARGGSPGWEQRGGGAFHPSSSYVPLYSRLINRSKLRILGAVAN